MLYISVNFPIVATGIALVFTAGTAAVSPLLVSGAVAGLGALGVGGVLTQTMCLGPVMCRTQQGQCCVLVFFNGRLTCPSNC